MRIEHPYHEGELAVQERAGELDNAERNGFVIADSIVKGALKFFPKQPMTVLGSLDAKRDVWASILFGRPGFMSAPDDRTLLIDLKQAGIDAHDPFWANIAAETRIGALMIELSTRRRLRVNGSVSRPRAGRLALHVAESYPNCPKYVQRRDVTIRAVDPSAATQPHEARSLSDEQAEMLRKADMFFVASAHAHRGVDVSHRGGRPGFVEVVDDVRLRIPDYAGNSMFNTLGNFMVHPRAGLAFIDFEHGRSIQIIGRPEILWDQDDPAGKTGGTRRYWELVIERVRESDLPVRLSEDFLDDSPHSPG